MSTEERETIYWSCENVDEQLRHTTLDEAVEDYLVDIDWSDEEATVRVFGYARVQVSAHVRTGLEDILEAIDEEYGDPKNTRHIRDMITPRMGAAFEALVEAIEKDYEPWACEVVEERHVLVLAWVREHMPHWLPTTDGEERERMPIELVNGEWRGPGDAESSGDPQAVITYVTEPSPETGHVGWCWWALGQMGDAPTLAMAKDKAETWVKARLNGMPVSGRWA
jgi:hypothetical protein